MDIKKYEHLINLLFDNLCSISDYQDSLYDTRFSFAVPNIYVSIQRTPFSKVKYYKVSSNNTFEPHGKNEFPPAYQTWNEDQYRYKYNDLPLSEIKDRLLKDINERNK